MLVKYESYTRKEVHDLFSKDTIFQPRTGTWGLHGIIKVPEKEKDYIFFVTFNQSAVDYLFEESISKSGVLTWQSQPKQTFKEKRILDFIYHNHLENNIYLFLRTNKNLDYTYLGKLAYLDHDKFKEKPVHFKWRIINWNPSENLLQKIGLTLIDDAKLSRYSPINSSLLLKNPPYSSTSRNIDRKFYGKRINFNEKVEENKSIGLYGEKLVLEYERTRLKLSNRCDLAEQVMHVSETEGDGKGYDILSFNIDGSERFIEVKTTKGDGQTPFYLSANELAFFQNNKENYLIYRVFEYGDEGKLPSLYKLNYEDFISLQKSPVNYIVYL